MNCVTPRSSITIACMVLLLVGTVALISAQEEDTDAEIAALIEQLGDKDPDKRASAATLLSHFDERAAPAAKRLGDCLDDPFGKVRSKAVWALNCIGPGAADAVPAIVEALHTEHVGGPEKQDDFRCDLVFALGAIGVEQSIRALVKLLDETGPFPRWAASVALENVGEPAVPYLIARLDEEPTGEIAYLDSTLHSIGAPAVPALVECLDDANELVRRRAASLLGDLADPRGVPALVDYLADDPAKAAWALGRMGEAAGAAVPVLMEYLGHDDPDVRWRSAQALGQVGPDALTAVPSLVDRLDDPSPKVRWGAAHSLGRLGDVDSVPALVEALGDGDSDVRRSACEALGRMGATSAASALEARLRDEMPRVRVSGADALVSLGRAAVAVPTLIECLSHEDLFVCGTAARALGVAGEWESPARRQLPPCRRSLPAWVTRSTGRG